MDSGNLPVNEANGNGAPPLGEGFMGDVVLYDTRDQNSPEKPRTQVGSFVSIY